MVEAAALFRRHAWGVALLALAAFLRFQGLNWDAGLMFHPDERNLAVAAAALSFPSHPVSEFHAYNGLAVYLPRILSELLFTLGVSGDTGVPEIAHAARLLSALFSTLAVVLVYAIGNRLGHQFITMIITWLATFSVALVQAAHFGTTESALVLVLMVLIHLSARHEQLSARARVLGYGLVLGLGMGFKTTALAFSIIPIAAYMMAFSPQQLRSSFVELLLIGIEALAVLVISTPQVITATHAYFDTMNFEHRVVTGEADVFWTFQFHDSVNGVFEISQIPWLLDPVTAAFVLPGMLLMLLRGAKGDALCRAMLPGLAFGCVYIFLTFGWYAKFMRYQMPLIPFYILGAGIMLNQISGNLAPTGRNLLLTIVLASSGFFGLNHASLYAMADPRITAWNWLAPRIVKGDVLVAEPVEIGPPLGNPKAAEFRTRFLPLHDVTGVSKIAAMSDTLQSGSWLLMASRRHFGVLPRMHQRFPEMCGYYDALWSGKLGYQRVAVFHRQTIGLLNQLDPSPLAEETYSVFDNPVVYVFKNQQHLSANEFAARINSTACPSR